MTSSTSSLSSSSSLSSQGSPIFASTDKKYPVIDSTVAVGSTVSKAHTRGMDHLGYPQPSAPFHFPLGASGLRVNVQRLTPDPLYREGLQHFFSNDDDSPRLTSSSSSSVSSLSSRVTTATTSSASSSATTATTSSSLSSGVPPRPLPSFILSIFSALTVQYAAVTDLELRKLKEGTEQFQGKSSLGDNVRNELWAIFSEAFHKKAQSLLREFGYDPYARTHPAKVQTALLRSKEGRDFLVFVLMYPEIYKDQIPEYMITATWDQPLIKAFGSSDELSKALNKRLYEELDPPSLR